MRGPVCGAGPRLPQRQARTTRSTVTSWSNFVATRARTVERCLKCRLAWNGRRVSVATRRPLTVNVTDVTPEPATDVLTAPQRPRRWAVNTSGGRARQVEPAHGARLC